jgi:hypothetical protein
MTSSNEPQEGGDEGTLDGEFRIMVSDAATSKVMGLPARVLPKMPLKQDHIAFWVKVSLCSQSPPPLPSKRHRREGITVPFWRKGGGD